MLLSCCADVLARPWDEREYGPNVDFREYSFLNHTDFPEDVRSAAIDVIVCQKGKGYCPEPDAPGTVDVNKVFMQEKLTSQQIQM